MYESIVRALLEIWRIILEIISISWWILVPLGLFFIWNEYWLFGKRVLFIRKLKWVLLEIKIPQEIMKTPKAMENIFTSLHSIYFGEPTQEDLYLGGKCLLWFSFEMVGRAGGVHFYIRAPEANRNLVESVIYAEYPDAEITLAEDYTASMPEILPNDKYDIWGNDYVLAKDNAYPIKTYEFFEAVVEERRLDPVSAITEVMSRLKEDEMIWIQILARPVSDKWKQGGEALRDRIMQRKKEKPKPGALGEFVSGVGEFSKNLSKAALEHPNWSSGSKSEEKFKMLHLSPGEQDVLKAVENKISKLGFESMVRFVYIDNKDSFTQANVSAVTGAFKQFSTQHLNSFKADSDTITFITSLKFTTKSWFRKSRLFMRKRKVYDMYRLRLFSARKPSVLNTEELATIFHFPLTTVEAPQLRRLATRKGEPPASLPIE